MALNAHNSSQSSKDHQLPPQKFLVYKPINVLPKSEYDVMYYQFLKVTVRIDNYFPLGIQAQEWDSNPDPESPPAL
ncbi:hypothetical protein DSO57_1005902 [Entomophthora muscae]|uniref:Uncharacterized protein n=1 Tax=Entomophthora muscae TaxID=34485 RepID=A0ACC2SAB3_9FUNG|nr:hypothetical protein DSO57_1005902 [Entomophthora muscae]